MAAITQRIRGRLPSPTIETVLILLWVYILQLGAVRLGFSLDLFVLRVPVSARPWTLLTTVYAHAGPVHLIANILVLTLIGLLVEPRITRVGFHALFLSAGVIAAGTVVILGAASGLIIGAIGASGAVFAIVGYGVTAPPAQETQPRNRRSYGGGYADREAASTGLAGVGSRSQPRDRGTPRLLLFAFGAILVLGPFVVGVGAFEFVGHAVGFIVGLATGVGAWVAKAER